MLIVFDSRANSGTTKHFAKQLAKLFKTSAINVSEISPYMEIEPYILCTYTIGYGEITEETQKFLDHHADKMLGVVANGSSNFRAMGLFGAAGDRISEKYGVELISKLDMGGTKEDLIHIAKRISVMTNIPIQDIVVDRIRPQSKIINGRFQLEPLFSQV